MSRIQFLLIIPLLLTGLFIVPMAVPYAHSALVGTVCIAKSGNTSCPPSPPLLNSSTTLPATMRVAVVINASAGLDGFDITLLANHTLLNPTGIDLTGSVLLGTPTIFVECIGGVHIAGSGTCPAIDTLDTIHLSATSALGSPLTSSPTTGLLFTALYSATGSTYNTPIGFQTGCPGGSVGGGVCVSIANATPSPNPETIQGAKFTDLPYFTLETAQGFGSPAIPIHTTNQQVFLNVTSINGFANTVTVTSSTPPAGITLTPLVFSVKVNTTVASVQPPVNVTVANSATPGIYKLNFTATSGTVPQVSLTVVLTVPSPDFTVTAIPAVVKFNVSSTGSSLIRVASLGISNFTGTVNLSLGIPVGLNASLVSSQLTVPQGGATTTTLKLNSTIYGMYTLNITATSGALTHTIPVSITNLDFTMHIPAAPLVLNQGTTSREVIDFTSGPAGSLYNVNVTITRIYIQLSTPSGPIGPATGITVTCTPSFLTITNSSASTEGTFQSTCNVSGNQAGSYIVTVVAASKAASHAIAFNVQVLGPDFTITPSATVETISVGGSATVNLNLTRVRGLNQSITPTSLLVPNEPSISAIFSPGKVFLNATSTKATQVITITTQQSTPVGIYILEVKAFPHAFNITVVVVTTTSPHDIAIYSVTPSSTSVTAGDHVTITIEAQNIGSVTETSTVIAIAGDQNVGQKNVTIAPGGNVNVTLTWDTSGFGTGAYMVGAKILAVPGETNLSNNLLRSASPVAINPANTSPFQSAYFAPSVIAALIVIVGIVGLMLLQARRKNVPKPAAQTG